jgi:hypothetical protein
VTEGRLDVLCFGLREVHMSLAAIDYTSQIKSTYLLISFMDSMVDMHARSAVQESRRRFLNRRAQRAVGVQQEPLRAMGSLSVEGHRVRQGVHDETEILRRARHSLKTSDRRIARQMQV